MPTSFGERKVRSMKSPFFITAVLITSLTTIASAQFTVPDDWSDIPTAIANAGGTGTILVRDNYIAGPTTIAGLSGPLTIQSVNASDVPTTGATIQELIIDANQDTTLDGFRIGAGAAGTALLYTGNSGAGEHTLRNCLVDTDGGGNGIEISGAPGNAGIVINIEDSAVSGNGANGIGAFQESNINVTGASAFDNNGAVGVAVLGTSSTLTVFGAATFSGNTNEGIWINANNCVVSIDGATINGNGRAGFSNNGTENLTATFTDCVISGNNSLEFGGALRLVGNAGTKDGSALVQRCVIVDNTAASDGGGILANNGLDLVIENSLIARNASGNFSGAVRVVDSNLTMVNCTLADNTGVPFGGAPDGISMESNADPIAVYVVNNIFTGHDTAIEGGYGSGTVNLELLNNVLDSARGGTSAFNGTNFGPQMSANNVGTITSDVALTDPAGDDYTLTTGSPAVLAGATQADVDAAFGASLVTVPGTDITGAVRPNPVSSTRPDIGAYEETTATDASSIPSWQILEP